MHLMYETETTCTYSIHVDWAPMKTHFEQDYIENLPYDLAALGVFKNISTSVMTDLSSMSSRASIRKDQVAGASSESDSIHFCRISSNLSSSENSGLFLNLLRKLCETFSLRPISFHLAEWDSMRSYASFSLGHS